MSAPTRNPTCPICASWSQDRADKGGEGCGHAFVGREPCPLSLEIRAKMLADAKKRGQI